MANGIVLNIDTTKSEFQNPMVQLRQGDGNYQSLAVTVTSNGEPFDLTGWTTTFMGTTSGGFKIIDSAVTVINALQGSFTYTPTKAWGQDQGEFKNAYFKFTKADEAASGASFRVNVLDAVDLTAEEAKDYISVVDVLIDDVKTSMDNKLVETKQTLADTQSQANSVQTNVNDLKAQNLNIKTTDNIWTGTNTFNKQIIAQAGVQGNIQGNAETATKLQTSRLVGGISFDGTSDITLPGVNAKGNQDTSGRANNANNADLSTKAIALQTPRKINGTPFDGTSDITITGSGALAVGGVYPTIADLIAANPDHNRTYITTDNGNWNYWNITNSNWTAGGVYQSSGIADDSIGAEKIYNANILSRSVNVLNTDELVSSSVANSSGIVNRASWSRTNYMPVKTGDVLRFKLSTSSSEVVIVTFDENKNVLRTFTRGTQEYTYFVILEGEKFIIFNMPDSEITKAIITFNAPMPLTYVKYGVTAASIPWLSVFTENLKIDNGGLNISLISDINATVSRNDLDPNLLINGSIAGATGIEENPSWSRTDYIPVTSGDYVYTNQLGSNYKVAGVFDTSKALKRLINGDNLTAKRIDFIDGDAYVVLNYRNTTVNQAMYSKNIQIPKKYTIFGNKLVTMANLNIEDTNINGKLSNLIKPWRNKSVIWFGDSIIAYDGQVRPEEVVVGFPTLVNQALGFSSSINKATPGHPIAGTESSGNIVSTVISSTINQDLVIIGGGTNDFRLNIPIGNIGSIYDTTFDRSTFIGSYRVILNYILNNKNDQSVLLMAPIQRDANGYNVDTVNGAGAKLIDYVNAVKELGKMYSIPVWDGYSDGGLNPLNLSTLTLEGVHPNNKGYKLISRTLIGKINNIKYG